MAAQVLAAAGTRTTLVARTPGDGHGATVEVRTTLDAPVRRPRGGPPNAPRRVFGREVDLASIEEAIQGRGLIVVAGEIGAGKSTAVEAALNAAAAGAVADGIVQIPGALGGMGLTVDEIAQRLYDALWDTSPNHRRVTASTAPAELRDCHPLLAIDGLHLSSDDQRSVANLIPGSAVIVTSDAVPFGGGDFVALGGLPRAASVRLLAERSGARGETEEPLLARAAELLQDWPGALATAADMVRAGRVSMEATVSRMETAPVSAGPAPAPAYERLLAVIDATFPRAEVRLLETIAGFAGISVREDLATWAAGAPPAAASGLVDSGVAWRASPRLQIDPGLRAALRRSTYRPSAQAATGALEAEPERVLAEDGTLDPLDVPDALLAFRAAIDGDHERRAGALARALDGWLMANRLWSQWDDVLHMAGKAADRLGDEVQAAWVLHQQGTRALLSGEFATAQASLTAALAMRRRVDPAAVSRTEQVLRVLRVVSTPPLRWLQRIGPRGAMLSVAAALVLITGLLAGPALVDALRALVAPTPTASPAVPSATPAETESPPPASLVTASPSVAPSASPTPVTTPLEVELTLDVLELLRNGDWAGTVTVSPSGGVGPYHFVLNEEVRDSPAAEVFRVSGTACEPARVAGAVTDAADGTFQFDQSMAPDRCATFVRPPPPDLGDPYDGYVQFENCESTQMVFGWSLGGEQPVTSELEVELWDGSAWVTHATIPDLREPIGFVDVPCPSSLRWRAATVSLDGWMSEWSEWSTAFVQATAVPVLDAVQVPATCTFTLTVSWSAEPSAGIRRYEVRVLDLRTGKTAAYTTDATSYSIDVPSCDTTYQWTVASMDDADRPGAPSDPGTFYMPPAGLSSRDLIARRAIASIP